MSGRPGVTVGPRRLIAFGPRDGGVGDAFGQTVRQLAATTSWTVVARRSGSERWPVRSAVAALRASFDEVRCADAIHIEFGSNDTSLFWLAMFICAYRRSALIVVHDFPLLAKSPGAGLLPPGGRWRTIFAHRVLAPACDRHLKRRLLRSAGAIAVLNEDARRQWSTIARGEVIVIPHGGVRLSARATPPSTGHYVLYAGFIGPSKGVDTLLNAWRELVAESELDLVIAADPRTITEPRLERLHREAEHWSRPPRWIGRFASEDALQDGIARAAVVVLPYRRSSPASGILVRAMLEGRAIVATAVPAVANAISDGLQGLVVPPDDAIRLAAALRTVIHDGALRDRLGALARERAQELYSSKRQAELLLDAYTRLAEDKGARRGASRPVA